MESGKNIRMCVVCRKRLYKEKLNRLQCINNKLVKWQGMGRSFYVCKDCINDKKFIKFISRICNISKEEAKNQIFHFPFYIAN